MDQMYFSYAPELVIVLNSFEKVAVHKSYASVADVNPPKAANAENDNEKINMNRNNGDPQIGGKLSVLGIFVLWKFNFLLRN